MTQIKSQYSKLDILMFLGSSFLQSAFYWALTIFISKSYGIRLLGEYSYVLAILTPVIVLGGLQLKSYLLTKAAPDIKGQAKWLRIFFPTVLLTLTLITLIWVEPLLVPIYLPLAFIKWSELWSDFANGIVQLDTGLSQVNKAIFLRYLSLFSALVLVWILKLELTMALASLAIVSCLVAISDHYKSGLNQVPIVRLGSRETFKTTISLSLSALLTALLVNIPRYILKEYHSVEVVGLFSMLFYYYVIPSMVINYACQGLLKQMKDLSSHPYFLVMTISSLGIIAISYFVALKFFGGQITKSIYETSTVWSLELSVLIAGAFFLGGLASIMHYALMGRNIYEIQLKTNILSSLLCLISGLFLIAKYGVIGAFISFILGLLVQSGVYIIAYSKLKNE